MNKEEIQHRIKKYELVRECAEENLNELNIQLAEAEKLEKLDKLLKKPKLRHGDFGYCDEPCYPRIVLDEDKLASGHHVFDRNETDEPTVIFGNVFKLMKEWSEPLEERLVAGIRISVRSDCIFVGEYRLGTPEVQDLFWRTIAQEYFTLKRKK